MRTTGIMFLKRKRGVSTILGTIIFIGIMFTSVIPMMLVMKQADTIYTQKVHEMESRDDERSSEILVVNAFPVNSTSTELKIEVENIGVVSVKIIRVWINDVDYSENDIIKTGDTTDIGPYGVAVENGTSYSIKVITERGNSFASACGVLYYTDG